MTNDNGNHATTPGPWTIEYDNHGNGSFSEWWNVGPGGDGIAKVWNEADARLIAAAPETAQERDRLKAINAELVEALERTVCALEEVAEDGGTIIYNETMDIARAALAKARE